ncbi:transmembrane 6 superfamily member 1-like [Gigantopelta aegis]|uniref:transmembrane 6 superfamily member 1-like n=1 Tax=Gigantopelta aegis TaxID=1735272 RepID=UPI001B88A1D9|nr:transmembrane 6 superfamily member 1-like [Gigantopelta aegis]
MTFSGPSIIFLTSLSAIPLSYFMNKISQMIDQRMILVAGVCSLLFVTIIPYLHVKYNPRKTDSFFYVLSIFTFSSVIDLVIGLENDGLIENFMTFYLKEGEPYLKTAHGTMICYWDGVIHYALYLMILAAISWGQSYREVALYWVGSLAHSMLVLMPAILMGPHGVKWPVLLNIPFLIIPFFAGGKFLRQRPSEEEHTEPSKMMKHPRIWRRPLDLFLVLYFLAASCVAILRFTAAFGGKVELAERYAQKYEPYLMESSKYAAAQMAVYLFFFLPYYAGSIYALIFPGESWMSDWSLIHAGAAAQAQFSHMGSSVHYRTPYVHRVPQNMKARAVFWVVNVLLFAVPQLMAYRCTNEPSFFQKANKTVVISEESEKNRKKK